MRKLRTRELSTGVSSTNLKKHLLILTIVFAPALVGALTSCTPAEPKEIVVSIPADGRWDRYPTPEAVCGLLDTIAWAGFNSIKVDVKPVVGYCEFESSYLEPMRTMKTRPGAHEDWDYAGVFLREGRKRGLKVSLTCAVFPTIFGFMVPFALKRNPDSLSDCSSVMK